MYSSLLDTKGTIMTELLVGTGGWAYFQVPDINSLKSYALAFNFVEVNSTFYEIPRFEMVKSWRHQVPADFEFSVRCHRDLTHRCQLEPIDSAFKTFAIMQRISKVLNSKFLVLVTPASINFDSEKLKRIRDFFASVNLNYPTIVWEIRRRANQSLPLGIKSLMKEYGIIHCTDLSKDSPIMKSDSLYTRIFGKGKHNIYQFTDDEMLQIKSKITRSEANIAVISFHNVRMYKDAARYKVFEQTGKFPSVTGKEGLLSLRKILSEDAMFPTNKQELIRDQGWKVIDLARNRRVHASTVFKKLPDVEFKNIEEILQSTPLT